MKIQRFLCKKKNHQATVQVVIDDSLFEFHINDNLTSSIIKLFQNASNKEQIITNIKENDYAKTC